MSIGNINPNMNMPKMQVSNASQQVQDTQQQLDQAVKNVQTNEQKAPESLLEAQVKAGKGEAKPQTLEIYSSAKAQDVSSNQGKLQQQAATSSGTQEVKSPIVQALASTSHADQVLKDERIRQEKKVQSSKEARNEDAGGNQFLNKWFKKNVKKKKKKKKKRKLSSFRGKKSWATITKKVKKLFSYMRTQ